MRQTPNWVWPDRKRAPIITKYKLPMLGDFFVTPYRGSAETTASYRHTTPRQRHHGPVPQPHDDPLPTSTCNSSSQATFQPNLDDLAFLPPSLLPRYLPVPQQTPPKMVTELPCEPPLGSRASNPPDHQLTHHSSRRPRRGDVTSPNPFPAAALLTSRSPLNASELNVLRAQYEKEGEMVGIQTKFNYAWVLPSPNTTQHPTSIPGS